MLQDGTQPFPLTPRSRGGVPCPNSCWCPERGRETQCADAISVPAATIQRRALRAECHGVCRVAGHPREQSQRRKNPACLPATCGTVPENRKVLVSRSKPPPPERL